MADALAKSGVGYDTVYLNDLQKCDLRRYKCVLFVGCAVMDKRAYAFVRDKVMADGRTVAFMRENAVVVDNQTQRNEQGLVNALLAETKQANCNVVRYENFVYDSDEYRKLFAGAGAHIYTDGGEVVCAQNNFVMVHTKGKEKTLLHLSCGDVSIDNGDCNTAVFDNLTGERVY